MWLGAQGDFPSGLQMCDLIERSAGVGTRTANELRSYDADRADLVACMADAAKLANRGSGVCLILDDLGIAPTEEDFAWFRQAAAVLWRTGVHLVVTTRSIEGWLLPAVGEWAVVDEHDLALRESEAQELSIRLDTRLSSQQVSEICTISAGHVALCSAVMVQAARHGLAASCARALPLEVWLKRAVADLSAEDAEVARLAALLLTGTARDLAVLGVGSPVEALKRTSRVVPLLHVVTKRNGETSFSVHDLLDGYFAEHGSRASAEEWRPIFKLLAEREGFARSCELLLRLGDLQVSLEWVRRYGRAAFELAQVSALDRLLASLPMTLLMGEGALLVLWSQVCFELGRYEESVSKAKAARSVAEHDRDWTSVRGATAQMLSALINLGRQDQADSLAEEVLRSSGDRVDDMLLAEAHYCIGCGKALRGDPISAQRSFGEAVKALTIVSPESPVARLAMNSLAAMPSLTQGDFQSSRRAFAKLVNNPRDMPATRAMIRGNMAVCLVECGRVGRAESLARSAIAEAEGYGLDMFSGAYLPVRGLIRYLHGDVRGAEEDFRRGLSFSASTQDDAHGAINALWLSQALRAEGRVAESLSHAESSLEVLTVHNEQGFCRPAGLEVAASLLASEDIAAARETVAASEDTATPENRHHALRAAIILAECDRRDGDTDAAVGRLVPFAGYVRSENPNLLLSMYCRAFPALMGVLSLAVGAANLPVHMLRMIPPESAEMILSATRGWLEEGAWSLLGARLLGDEEFERFLARNGLPVCHVRFFGGLEVSIGGRSIREKDWRKRKARLLCAMLVLRRGQDVPREQLLEHLFAEMDPERAKNNLYVVWSTMKSVLMGDGAKGSPLPYFEAVGGVCRAVRENIRSDVDDFDKLMAAAAKHEAEGELGAALRDYEALSSLYRGELLPGDVYDDWFAELREHYKITFVNAMLAASGILTGAGDPGNALMYIRRAIQTDPLREDLYQTALRCQIAAGQRSGAIDTYLQCRSRLSEDLGLDPSAETRALYEQILAMEDRPRLPPKDSLLD
jgi:DNA-binding SARP family transcriptional activator/ATP/maltotriose-dependent transcriptional regulator MalT